MYFCAPCLARFFVLCQVYSSSRHLKNAPFAAAWQTFAPQPFADPATLNTESRANGARLASCLNKEEEPRPALLVACGLWSVCQCSQGVPEPLKFCAKVLLFSHICKYICIKICSIREFCVAPS